MSILVPYHLREIADVVDCDAVHGHLTMQILCPCGCTRFFVYENCFTDAERTELDRYQAECNRQLGRGTIWGHSDAEGNVHTYRRGILGIPREVTLPEAPPFANFHSIKAVCSDCGREYLLFDCRIHGYDGAICGMDCSSEYMPQFRQKFVHRAPARRLRVTIMQDIPPEELLALVGECGGVDAAMKICSECFSEIMIAAESAGRSPKYIPFFELETA